MNARGANEAALGEWAQPEQPEQPDVFVSYSRKDAVFVRRLAQALESHGREVWVDWKDIPAAASWRAEVNAAIENAGAFVFVLSPDSRDSTVCQVELAHAAEINKRVLPLLRSEVDPDSLPGALSEPHWISFVDDASFDDSLETLLAALETDLEWVRTHTRLLVSALRWSAARDASLLLRGSELEQAERELAANTDKEPRPTPLHTAFVLASRKASARRQRITLGAALVALSVSIALGGVALAQRNDARAERDRADAQARLATSRQLAAEADAVVGAKLDLGLWGAQTRSSCKTGESELR